MLAAAARRRSLAQRNRVEETEVKVSGVATLRVTHPKIAIPRPFTLAPSYSNTRVFLYGFQKVTHEPSSKLLCEQLGSSRDAPSSGVPFVFLRPSQEQKTGALKAPTHAMSVPSHHPAPEDASIRRACELSAGREGPSLLPSITHDAGVWPLAWLLSTAGAFHLKFFHFSDLVPA